MLPETAAERAVRRLEAGTYSPYQLVASTALWLPWNLRRGVIPCHDEVCRVQGLVEAVQPPFGGVWVSGEEKVLLTLFPVRDALNYGSRSSGIFSHDEPSISVELDRGPSAVADGLVPLLIRLHSEAPSQDNS